ncbi:MAG: LemA family protein [Spirochaetales bacterium]|jgi:LemA protein|nr:LemA family protein [Spirochaetales bacterium]
MSARGKSRIGIIVLGVVVLGIIIGSWYIKSRNQIVTLDEDINGAWAEIENQLQRRSDLIPNLVATVKGFASQEEKIFSDIANARARMAGAGSVGETAEGYNELQGALSRLLVVVENYPDLKSNQNFIQLQDELAGTENRIAVARKRYNDKVRTYNTKVRTFPGSSIARSMGFEAREYFEIDESARIAPTVDFGG